MASPVTDSPGTDSGGGGAHSITAADIAARLGGELLGDRDALVSGVAPLDMAHAGDVSLLTSSKYADEYAETAAGIVLIKPEFRDTPTAVPTRIVVDEPLQGLLALLPQLYPESIEFPTIHATAIIGRGAVVGERVSVGPYAVIGAGARIGNDSAIGSHCVIGENAVIGEKCRLYPTVTIYPRCVLGDRNTLHAGVRIGSDGFGYLGKADGHHKIRHVGRVVIGDDVEIGSNSAIDRGSIGDTLIGAGTKIDNLVHIAHNVRVGKRCLILAGVGIAGSCRIEDGVVIAGQVGLAGHITVGKGARLAAQAGVISDVPAGETWSGFPARRHGDTMRGAANLHKLGAMMKKLEALLEEQK